MVFLPKSKCNRYVVTTALLTPSHDVVPAIDFSKMRYQPRGHLYFTTAYASYLGKSFLQEVWRMSKSKTKRAWQISEMISASLQFSKKFVWVFVCYKVWCLLHKVVWCFLLQKTKVEKQNKRGLNFVRAHFVKYRRQQGGRFLDFAI